MTTHFTARSPEDLLAVVPAVLGFVPHDSVVMLTFGARHPFHARVDLPPLESASEVVALLRDPAVHHQVRRVVLVLYAEQPRPAEQVGRVLVRGFRDAGIEVVDLIRADGRRWFPLLRGRQGREAGVPYDVSAHPFAAQTVLDGRVTHASRGELAATLVPEADRVARVAAAVLPGQVTDPAWVRAAVRRLAGSGDPASDEEAARLLTAIGDDVDCRDAAWAGLDRSGVQAHVALWTDLLRRAPDDLAGPAAAVLGLVAWLAGHGALAWCAVDRAEALVPDHTLSALVADLLTAAVPPSAWEGVFARAETA